MSAKPLPVLAVIGNTGRMGAMLAGEWQKSGFTVQGADRAAGADADAGGRMRGIPGKALAAAVKGADAVILCVPARVLNTVLQDLAPYLVSEQVLVDITSVKVAPMRLMERFFPGPVVGTHPLFGPAPEPGDLVTAITPGTRAAEAHVEMVRRLFMAMGSRVFLTTPEEHDRSAAFVQGLNFVSSAAYFAALAHREELLPFLTPSFRRRMEGARKLLCEDGDMFEGFTTANPMLRDAVHTFRLFLDLAESGGLPDVLRQARWWYGRDKA